jgi:NAD(P)H-dependent FMN reductase
MRAVLLSAAPAGHASMSPLADIIQAELLGAGYATVTSFSLTTNAVPIASCLGELDCWLKTPGRCRTHDAEEAILGAVHDADALVLFGPLTFGGHCHVLKGAIDRMIPLLSPFFTKRSLLTHHLPRYERTPGLFSIAWSPAPSPAMAATYASLNDANAVNYLSPGCGAVVLDDAHRGAWGASLREVFLAPGAPGASLTEREAIRRALLVAAAPDSASPPHARVVRAALLVGSPKAKGTSASEAIAAALSRRLERRGVEVERHFASEFVHNDDRARASAGAIAACDLFVLLTPLYADALPALTTHALELVGAARASLGSSSSRFVALVNCGFPEPEQVRTAMRIARHFADESAYVWGGGLPLGGGGVVKPDCLLDEAVGGAAHVVRALDLAAPALAAGASLPVAAITTIAASSLPDGIYRLLGDAGMRWIAHKHGVPQRALSARPLDSG